MGFESGSRRGVAASTFDLEALRERPLRRLLAAQWASLVGDYVVIAALLAGVRVRAEQPARAARRSLIGALSGSGASL